MTTKQIGHPVNFINQQLVVSMRRFAAAAEKRGCLHPQQWAIIHQNNWFNLFVPKKYNGLALPLPEALKIEEGLAWVDGSIGWTVTLCSGAAWFAGFMHPAIAANIFDDKNVCLGGSGKANGIAKMVDGGYEITGYWNYATGAAHATVFTANCVIEQEGNTLKDKDGNSIVRSFLFFKEEVTLHKSWNCMGMKGTSSDSFEVKQLFVNNDRAFVIDKAGAILEDAIYQYPFLHFAEVTLAVNICGMAFRFLDLYEELVKERDNTGQSVTRVLSKETALFLEAKKEAFKTSRELFYAAVMYSWEACVGNNGEVFCGLLQTVSQTSRELAANARQLVDELYPYCGLAAANPDNEINRVWRNLHTASQHPLLLY